MRRTVNRRHLLVSLAAGPTLAMLIAACGDPDSVPGDASPSSVSPTTAP
ncbi:MAG: hypothetical protein JWM12_3203, partial [Ilumatobacteraceae bacterium]|nr:hypothetical protein [Ilumatobacteraceae bacterium]